MTQPRTIAHRHDPASSHAAAREHVQSGANARQLDAVIAAVRAHPGHTGAELAQMGITTGGNRLDVFAVRRRLTDAMHAGRIEQGEARRCRVARRMAVTWQPVTPASAPAVQERMEL